MVFKTRSIVGAYLVSFLFCSSVFANTPTVGTVTPSSGSSHVDIAQVFTTTYADSSGWQHLWTVNFLVNTQVSGANCFSGVYNQNSNQLFLRDDSGTSWLGGYAPGSANIIENSYAKLDCSQTTVSGNGTTLTVNWKVTFKAPFTGAKNTYLLATDDANANSGVIQKGTWTIKPAPTVGTISPSSGTGQVSVPQTFTGTYSDSDGWQTLLYAHLVVNTEISGAYCLSAYYDRNTNQLFIRDDPGTGWLGGYAPGSANVIENSFASLDCSQTTVSGNGTTMTVNWRVTFKSAFTGAKNTYLRATEDSGSTSGTIQKGTWTIQNNPPTVGTVTPSSGTGHVDVLQAFTAIYSDADGWQNLWYVNLFVNTTDTSGANCFFGSYNRVVNQLFILNDAGTAWLGGYAPGSANVIENSYVRLDCSQTTVTGSGNDLTVHWAVTFKSTFTGAKNTYTRATDNANATTGFIQKGTWIINVPPTVGTITPSSGTGQVDVPQTFIATYSDSDGWQNLWIANFLVNTQVSGASCLSAYYDQNSDQLFMRSDSGTAWLGGYAPGSANVIENSYARLDCSQTTVSGNGATMTVNWKVTFKPLFTGVKNTYLGATDDTGYYTGAFLKGTWTIQADTTPPQVAITEPLDGAVFTDP